MKKVRDKDQKIECEDASKISPPSSAMKFSRCLSQMKSHYQAIVVGSGYGGAVAAARLSQVGVEVAILEKGREISVGEFPETPSEIRRISRFELRNHSWGPRDGLYRFNGEGEYFLGVASGLGGGSLINSGVMDRPDPRVFMDPIWPEALRKDLDDGVQRGFEKAYDVLAPQNFKASASPSIQNRNSLEQFALKRQRTFKSPDLTIDFQGGVNSWGEETQACNQCGQCSSGCNRGSKGTLHQSYLRSAFQQGAHIFTQLDVQWVEKVGARWVVFFQSPHLKNPFYEDHPLWVSADTLILSAGTLGTCEILMRSKKKGLSLSSLLGQGVSRNGSRLEFSYDTQGKKGCSVRPIDAPDGGVGPNIMGTLDLRDTQDLDEGIVLQDGVSPSWSQSLLSWMLPLYSSPQGSWVQSLQRFGKSRREDAFLRTQNFLVVGHDDACGKVILQGDQALFQWGQSRVFTEKLTPDHALKMINQDLGGQHVKLPFSVSVHPLGGCCMGDSAEAGVVSHAGEVFSGAQGYDVHSRLYVMDGSIIPRSLGINPFWSIAALAERNVALLIAKWKAENSFQFNPTQTILQKSTHPSDPTDLMIQKDRDESLESVQNPKTSHRDEKAEVPQALPHLIFTERLTGVLSWFEEHLPQQRKRSGNHESRVEMVISLFVHDDWNAKLVGLARIPELSEHPLRIEQGRARLFQINPKKIHSAELIHEGKLVDIQGRSYRFFGRKDFSSSRRGWAELWKDTTTFEWTLSSLSSFSSSSQVNTRALNAKGILRVSTFDVIKLIGSFRSPKKNSFLGSLQNQGRFAQKWISKVGDIYSPFSFKELRLPQERRNGGERPLRVPPRQDYEVMTADLCSIKLIRFQGGSGTPVLLLHGYSANENSFLLDTVDMNLVEYLTSLGRDVWIGCWRSNGLLDSARTRFTLDDVARYDHPALLARIMEISGCARVDVIAHCVGSLTLLMSLMGGWSRNQVRSLVATQVGFYWDAPPLLALKARSRLPEALQGLGIHALPVTGGEDDSLGLKMMDQLLHLHPQQKEVICRNPTCRRTSFLFGPIFNHEKLNEKTHAHLGEQFGFASVHAFRQLALIAKKGEAVTWRGDSYLKQNLKGLQIPITFLRGSENQFIGQSSTRKTFNHLVKEFPSHLYRHIILESYGHGDIYIGKDAAKEVFPYFKDHLQWVEQGLSI